MMRFLTPLALAAALIFSTQTRATGEAICESGPEEGWVSREELKTQLAEKGWDVRRIKVDGGCYEVYALNEKGEKVEAYFHPETLEPVPGPVPEDH